MMNKILDMLWIRFGGGRKSDVCSGDLGWLEEQACQPLCNGSGVVQRQVHFHKQSHYIEFQRLRNNWSRKPPVINTHFDLCFQRVRSLIAS
jgi:hypothetical protein